MSRIGITGDPACNPTRESVQQPDLLQVSLGIQPQKACLGVELLRSFPFEPFEVEISLGAGVQVASL